jgi:hypothetical protein
VEIEVPSFAWYIIWWWLGPWYSIKVFHT